MASLEALIFDVDGTIADTERDGHRPAFNQAFAAAKLDWHWSIERYGDLLEVGGGKERIKAYVDRAHPTFQPSGGDLGAFAADLHRAKSTYYRQLLQTGAIPARSGVKRLLQAARQQNIRLAIATTSQPEAVNTLLQVAIDPAAPDWFEVIAAGDVVPAKKPAPDIYQYALDRLKLPPTACLAIEDSYPGLQAASQAGLATVITVNPYTQSQDFRLAALVVDQLGEPEQPFQVLDNPLHLPLRSTYFDVPLAEALLAAHWGDRGIEPA